MKRIPDPNEIFPNEYKTSCFIKNVVTAPNIQIGEYTYYDDAQVRPASKRITCCLTIRNLEIG